MKTILILTAVLLSLTANVSGDAISDLTLAAKTLEAEQTKLTADYVRHLRSLRSKYASDDLAKAVIDRELSAYEPSTAANVDLKRKIVVTMPATEEHAATEFILVTAGGNATVTNPDGKAMPVHGVTTNKEGTKISYGNYTYIFLFKDGRAFQHWGLKGQNIRFGHWAYPSSLARR